MKKLFMYILFIFITISFTGCATIATSKVKDFTKDSDGIRVFPLRMYLMVGKEDAKIEFWPDYTQAYDIKPVSFLAKNNFTITIGDKGNITNVTADMDSTAVVAAIADIVTALANAGVFPKGGPGAAPKTDITIPKPYGLDQGIYRLDDDGIHWIKLELKQSPR